MDNSLFPLVFLMVYAKSVAMYSQVDYYIKPSSNDPCPHDPCLTLSEFTAATDYFSSYHSNISLSFLAGNHNLDAELHIIFYVYNFSMTKNVQGPGTVIIKCSSQSGRFNVSESSFVSIKDLNFIGCGGNRASQVKQFIVEGTIFQGVESRGTVLILNNVTVASIARSSFLSNKHSPYFEQHTLVSYDSDQYKLDYLYLKRNSSFSVGGALYTAFSKVSITNCKFEYNSYS